MSDSAGISAAIDYLPVRMVAQYVYCPRLFYLEMVNQEFDHNAFTMDGKYQHRNVDIPKGNLPDPETMDEENLRISGLMLSGKKTPIIARFDIIESEHGEVFPIEYKRAKSPGKDGTIYDSDRIQLCCQGIILSENGYRCSGGFIYFTASHKREEIPFDPALILLTKETIKNIQELIRSETIPPPLEDSPRCVGCSLSAICLPDEINQLSKGRKEPRKLIPAGDVELPLYINEQGAKLSKKGDQLIIYSKEKKHEFMVRDVSHVSLFGNVQVSTQVINQLFRYNIPITYFSYGGWFQGISRGMDHKNIELRIRQFGAAEDKNKCLSIGKEIVKGKILNCRTLFRRNQKSENGSDVLVSLKNSARAAESATNLEQLLGVEGFAAKTYFSSFQEMFTDSKKQSENATFEFSNRNRRPPTDPVNAALSFAYALLTKDLMITLFSIGFDPYLGFYHQPKYGKPALALDMMEQFRPLIADSVVITLINSNIIGPKDFIWNGNACNLNEKGKKKLVEAYERRMNQLITHPVFGYKISYRRVLEVQCRLLGRYLNHEIDSFPNFLTR